MAGDDEKQQLWSQKKTTMMQSFQREIPTIYQEIKYYLVRVCENYNSQA